MDNKLERLKKDYMNIPIPGELDFAVRKILKDNGRRKICNDSLKKMIIAAASAAAAFVVLTAGVNTIPVFAETLSKVPVKAVWPRCSPSGH